jgi:hypothetical protein
VQPLLDDAIHQLQRLLAVQSTARPTENLSTELPYADEEMDGRLADDHAILSAAELLPWLQRRLDRSLLAAQQLACLAERVQA